MTVIPGTQSQAWHTHHGGWAHIRPVSLRRWQRLWSSPPRYIGKAAWPWQGKAAMLGRSELPLRPANTLWSFPVSMSREATGSNFPKQLWAVIEGCVHTAARCHTRLAQGPGTALRAFPKCPKRAAGTAATGKQVHGEPQAQERGCMPWLWYSFKNRTRIMIFKVFFTASCLKSLSLNSLHCSCLQHKLGPAKPSLPHLQNL